MQTILALEDNDFALGAVNTILSRAGYTLLTAESESAALSRAEKHKGPIHLLIADATMIGRTGKRMVVALQSSHPEMTVLYISAYTREDLIARGVLDPGDVLLQKPFPIGVLCDHVASVLSTRSAGVAVMRSGAY